MEFQDYYAILGLPKTASEKEIRSAYRKLARQCHPDLNPGNPEAEERFKQINEAHEVLSDPEKRKRYDELGSRWREYEQWQRAGGQQGQADWQDIFQQAPGGTRYEYRTMSEEDLEDLFGEAHPFSDFFDTYFASGQPTGGRSARPRRGRDLEAAVEVSLAEAYKGTTRLVSLQTLDGQTRRIEVDIPAGVADGSRVRIAGQGLPGQSGGPAGDLYLLVSVQPDSRFERRGNDVYTKVQASLAAMLTGGEVRVPTPDGRRLTLTIPAGTQDGRVFRLRGQGIAYLNRPDQRGDLYAEVHVRLPEQLTQRQRELIEELGRTESGDFANVT
jgi:curved DNA-binding protein